MRRDSTIRKRRIQKERPARAGLLFSAVQYSANERSTKPKQMRIV